jgi:uncharacterized protein
MKNIIAYALLLTTLVLNCKPKESPAVLDQAYYENFEESRNERDQRRVKYLELCGLFKLDTKGTSFGLDSKRMITTYKDDIKHKIGIFQWDGNAFTFESFNEVSVLNESNNEVQHQSLTLDSLGDSEVLYYKNLKWRIITRSGSLYLRVWDKENPAIQAFKSFAVFEPNSSFIFDADFKYFKASKSELVASKLGVDDVAKFIGSVHFYFEGEAYTLDVGESGWIMVSDATNGKETYGSGRYIYVDIPETDGKVHLDFNYLYNPPCSYSEFTTCLLPPLQNRLPFRIEAGELIEHENLNE